MITAAAAGFTELINISYVGIAFVFPDWVHVPQMNFFAAALLPILFVVPLFDILTYFGILPFVIRWIGKLLTFLTRAPKFESFFAIEMMFLGNTEALAVSKLQLMKMSCALSWARSCTSSSCKLRALCGVCVPHPRSRYPRRCARVHVYIVFLEIPSSLAAFAWPISCASLIACTLNS